MMACGMSRLLARARSGARCYPQCDPVTEGLDDPPGVH